MAQTARVVRSIGTPTRFVYRAPASGSTTRKIQRSSLRLTGTVIQGPWSAVASNSTVVPAIPVEDEFVMFAEDALEWAEAALPLAVEVWPDE
jgi:hypothetical protein